MMEIFFIDMTKYVLDEKFLKTFLKNRSFSSSKKEREHCYGRFLVNTVAKDFYKIKDTTLEIKNKKPYFINSDIQFSISHSENIVLVAFDKNPIGADIEIMKERNFKDIFARYNVKEPATKDLFYKFWTEFEAKLKLQGNPKNKVHKIFQDNFMLSIVGNFNENDYAIYELTPNGLEKQ